MAVDASGLIAKIETYADRVAFEGAAEMLRWVDEDVPVDTRQLKDSGDITRMGRRRFRLRYPANYASYTDTGTRPHVIVPRRARALRFRVGNQIVYATRVNHPGNPGTRWWSDKVTPEGWRMILRRVIGRVRLQ